MKVTVVRSGGGGGGGGKDEVQMDVFGRGRGRLV